MKVFALFATAVFAEKARPDEIDAVKRVNELKRMSDECSAQLHKNNKENSGASRNITRKLARFHKQALRFCQLHSEACAAEFGEFEPGKDRIDESDPCKCVNGVSGGYKSFFNRVADISESKHGKDHANRREQVKTLAKKITANLNKSYGCAVTVPVKN